MSHKIAKESSAEEPRRKSKTYIWKLVNKIIKPGELKGRPDENDQEISDPGWIAKVIYFLFHQ